MVGGRPRPPVSDHKSDHRHTAALTRRSGHAQAGRDLRASRCRLVRKGQRWAVSASVVFGIIGGLVCLVVVLVLVWTIVTYNRLVRQRNQVEASWAQIDVQLKRRYDLIPNLVETVKGYAAHEKGRWTPSSQARNGAVAAASPGPAGRAEAENVLTQTLGRLFALAEAYPT